MYISIFSNVYNFVRNICHPWSSLRVNLVTAPNEYPPAAYSNTRRMTFLGGRSNLSQICGLLTLWIFRFRQLDSVFMTKVEITRPAEHSIIKNKKWKYRERANTKLNNKMIMFLVRKRTNKCYEIIVVISMFHSL